MRTWEGWEGVGGGWGSDEKEVESSQGVDCQLRDEDGGFGERVFKI